MTNRAEPMAVFLIVPKEARHKATNTRQGIELASLTVNKIKLSWSLWEMDRGSEAGSREG